ncbi:TetR/AcrR family transcriptional regulator [Corynebacterium pseudodiphtheriticum]|uniref:TetR/AcrR family transcriptional regulator n=1 Tax=Corynebacterium pseudodiphtheriticum TaxID=37637 RepID=UPI0020BF7782|nr:TetR family transcriptional regulator [Corynebacterium pseudodiphtheriticum]UQV54259.1 TetR/AcrR family transcriptional regulator [Corynebacterium pseudodiphtheriticum]
MPKKVDYGERRRELIESTWAVIARRGLANTTMREIAKQAGYANGALNPYFPNKADLLEATYNYVYAQTEVRIDEATQDKRALLLFARYVLKYYQSVSSCSMKLMSWWRFGMLHREISSSRN